MAKQISAISLGHATGFPMTFSMPQGSLILDCTYSKNNGLQVHHLIKDHTAPVVARTFVFYNPWSQTPDLQNKKRYWHVGTAHQKFEPQTSLTNGSNYTPDDITYFVFEVEQ